MYTMIIVDDEPAELRFIQWVVNNYNLPIHICGIGSNGREALNLADIHKPDFMIIDISMPVLNGLEAAKVIKEKYPKMQIFILTAFRRFSYAQAAVKINVEDYLCKPITPEVLAEVLKRGIKYCLRERLADCRQKRLMGKSREEDSKIQNMLEFLELSRVSRPHYDIQDLDNVEWVAVGYLLRPQHVVREYDLLQSFMRFLKQFPTFQHAVIASGGKILAWGNEKSDQIVQLLEFITEKWYTVSHSQFSAEIVHLDKHDTNALAKLRRVVYQADISQFWEESGIRHYDTDTIIIKPSIDIEIFGSQFINGIFLVGLDTPDIILEGLLSELKVKCSTREGIIQVITDFFTLVTHKIGELGIKSDITVLRHQLQKVVMLRDTISKVRILLFSFVKEVVDKIYSTKKTSAQTAVEWAQVFIQNNYWLDITLEFISSKLYLSPAYFSRIFKKYNGQGFSQYINSIRMEKAKSLLLTGKYSVAEVAEKIGIQDPSYFHYVFKKYHNTTPGYFIGLQNKNITCSV